MAIGSVFLMLAGVSATLWIVRLMRFGMLLRGNRPIRHDVGAGFEERIEARLAAMAGEKAHRDELGARPGFGRKPD